jgi:WD40 repeat protein
MRSQGVLSAVAGGVVAAVLSAAFVAAVPPTIAWSKANPGGLAGSVGGVAWSPNGALVASGLSERNLYIRNASDGSLVRSILQPQRSRGVIRLQFSSDSKFLAVGNAAATAQWRVYQVSSGTFLGLITASVDANSIVRYAVDSQLAGAPDGAGQLSKWKVSDMPVFVTTGTGYDKKVTRFQLSPDGTLETAQSGTTVVVRRVPTGAVVATITGQKSAFSPNSKTLAAWTASPNETKLYSTSTFTAQRTIATPNPADAIDVAWTPAGNLVGWGYRPFVKPDGMWDQTGIVHFWSAATGALIVTYDQQLSLGVTSGLAFRTDGPKQLVLGVYDGTTLAITNPA